jgi:hypothetical protein
VASSCSAFHCERTEVRLQRWLQARIVPKQHATLEIYQMDSHRLAFYLDADGQLVPLIQRALKRVRPSFQGLRCEALSLSAADAARAAWLSGEDFIIIRVRGCRVSRMNDCQSTLEQVSSSTPKTTCSTPRTNDNCVCHPPLQELGHKIPQVRLANLL